MNRMSRRSFAQHIFAAWFLPAAKVSFQEGEQERSSFPDIPHVIAGYTLSHGESELTAKFMAEYERNIYPLRRHDLPNSLAPSVRFQSPVMRKHDGEVR